jgi:ubiquinone/menaquinone biosynthesis C-methylase UbiE
MTISPAQTSTGPDAPNHHADHPGFHGIGGWLAAVTFVFGRSSAARLAVRLTEVRRADRVVDIGCGPGVAARHALAAGATSVVGVDPSPEMLRVGRAVSAVRLRRSARVDYRIGKAEELPVEDASATVVWSLATVHHWHDVDAGLAEVRRVLRPGGRFLAIERHTTPGATGHASHGWTDEQAATFADLCTASGFVSPRVDVHDVGRRRLLSTLVSVD